MSYSNESDDSMSLQDRESLYWDWLRSNWQDAFDEN